MLRRKMIEIGLLIIGLSAFWLMVVMCLWLCGVIELQQHTTSAPLMVRPAIVGVTFGAFIFGIGVIKETLRDTRSK